jgi:hypothetical protein
MKLSRSKTRAFVGSCRSGRTFLSLYRRDNFDYHASLALWKAYMHEAFSLMHPAWKRLIIDYDNLIDNPLDELTRMSDFVQITTSFAAISEFEKSFLKRSLRHSYVNPSWRRKDIEGNEYGALWEGLKKRAKEPATHALV